MKLNIRITGPAGLGINSLGEILGKIISNLGYNFLTDIEYESRIKGGVNYYDIFLSDNSPFLSNSVDIIIALNHESIDKNIIHLSKNGIIMISEKTREKISLKTKELIQKNNIKIISKQIDDKYENIYLLGLFVYYFDVKIKIVEKVLEALFKKKGITVINLNKKIIHNTISASFNKEKSNIILNKIGNKKNISYGNKLVAYGAIDTGLDYFSAYPMTPSSTILTEIINSKKIKYLQAEDEIAVINSALGASYTGKRAMVGTSGGGFALMTEALSFSIQAEIPIVVALSQRAGPSTGTPTFHETGDINFALHPTFGDFEHIVLYPSTLEEAYFYTGLGLNLAAKYQTIVIILLDKQFSELNGTIGNLKKIEIENGEFYDIPPLDYKRYEINESFISKRVMVGTKNGDFIATSYEHDEYGATSENFENKKIMTEKKFNKLNDFYKKEKIKGFEVISKKTKKMIITYSANSYTAKEFIKNNPEFGLILIKILKPLDTKLLHIIDKLNEIIFVENNYSGQLENYISDKFGLRYKKGLKISNLRKYNLLPFYIEDFNKLK